MDYLTNVFTTFLGTFKEVAMTSLSMEEQKSLRFQQKYLYLCCKDEWRSCGFGTTSGWV